MFYSRIGRIQRARVDSNGFDSARSIMRCDSPGVHGGWLCSAFGKFGWGSGWGFICAIGFLLTCDLRSRRVNLLQNRVAGDTAQSTNLVRGPVHAKAVTLM